MTISYQSEAEDLAEPSVRLYLGSKTASDARVVQTLTAWILGTIPLCLLSYFLHSQVYLLVGTFVGLGCSLFTYFSFRRAVKRRFIKYLKREYGPDLSGVTTYTVDGSQIECVSRGVTLSFKQSDLTSIMEDEKTLELKFEKKGLCVIPLRAFKSPGEKDEFIAKVRSGQTAFTSTSAKDHPPAKAADTWKG